ncbi:MAG: hypothetical protein K6B45_06965 [Bacteroidaceae bacterium]|nr:hypothetical protein [Bacteroidaceae bacterium]
MIIRKNSSYGLKGQQHPAQGNALGTSRKGNFRPEGAKALLLKAFDLV